MALSVRQQYLAKKAKLMEKTPVHRYRVTDPHHRPDLRNEFAGAKVNKRGEHHYVHLTPRQAQFYLDQGAIERHDALSHEEAAAQAKEAAKAPNAPRADQSK
jgi:hypothetical protein